MKLKESKFYELIDWLKNGTMKQRIPQRKIKQKVSNSGTNIPTIALFIRLIYPILFGISKGFG
jgi:hypothetical protein